MDFDIKKSNIFKAVKQGESIFLKFSKFLEKVSFSLFLVSFLLLCASFLDVISGYFAAKLMVLFLAFYLIFWEIDLFNEFKIRKIKQTLEIKDVVENIENYNLAELLNYDAAKVVIDAIKDCQKRKVLVSSLAILYSCLKINKDIELICLRLGLNYKKLIIDAKNCLEKAQKRTINVLYEESFYKVIRDALIVSVKRQHKVIGVEEIFTALAKNDQFFEKVLVEFDLKPEDIENLTAWLDSAKDMSERVRKFWTYENLLRQGSLGKDFSSGYTITLDKYSYDWTKAVAGWRYREIIGHKKEIEQTEIILAKSKLANVLIVGEIGTGRKSVIEAIAQKCFLGTSLPELNNKRVVELDPVLLAARIVDSEKLEAVLDQIFSEVVAAGNVILVIDDFENYIGLQGKEKIGTFDMSGIISKYLPIPQFQFVAITSYEGLHKYIERESAVLDMFDKIEVSEISELETINILQSAVLELEYKYKILVLYPSIREIVNLTARYMPSLAFPKKALDILDQAVIYVQKLKEKIVLPHHIAEIISKKTDIPVGKIETKEKEVLLNLENLIHNRIINQQEAVSEISIAMRRARAGIASKTRPMGSFLFLGPTGVGKTETAKALAQIYFGSEKKTIRLDMSEFQAISDIQRLIGAVSPVEMQGLLTTPVRESPFSLVLLDEIEKAHPNILNLFLQVLDEGQITDGHGRKVIFTNTIIIATSNAAADLIFKQVDARQQIEKDKLLNAIFERNIFRPEFVNRFDATVIFHPLTKENLLQIAQLSLHGLKKGLKERDIEFVITENLKEKIVDLSYKPEFGAREMRRVIQDKVENAIATALLSDKIKKGDRFEIDSETFEIVVNPVKA
jgi:ATP-dependent Clp protease ATP-binding subunit ClpC